jgi:hypothetical protein
MPLQNFSKFLGQKLRYVWQSIHNIFFPVQIPKKQFLNFFLRYRGVFVQRPRVYIIKINIVSVISPISTVFRGYILQLYITVYITGGIYYSF